MYGCMESRYDVFDVEFIQIYISGRALCLSQTASGMNITDVRARIITFNLTVFICCSSYIMDNHSVTVKYAATLQLTRCFK
jgi:hypothetical protein